MSYKLPRDEKAIPVSTYLLPKDKKQIEKLAKRLRRSQSYVINMIIIEYFEKLSAIPTKE